jgi:hypothetical protein
MMSDSMSFSRWFLLGQLATTLPLVGLIWTIQVVHYPLFAQVGREAFVAFHESHLRLITGLVGPLMLIELCCVVAHFFARDSSASPLLSWAGLLSLALIWAATMFFSVPAHHALGAGFDNQVLDWLVLTNWIRTVAWTIRGVLVLVFCFSPAQR